MTGCVLARPATPLGLERRRPAHDTAKPPARPASRSDSCVGILVAPTRRAADKAEFTGLLAVCLPRDGQRCSGPRVGQPSVGAVEDSPRLDARRWCSICADRRAPPTSRRLLDASAARPGGPRFRPHQGDHRRRARIKRRSASASPVEMEERPRCARSGLQTSDLAGGVCGVTRLEQDRVASGVHRCEPSVAQPFLDRCGGTDRLLHLQWRCRDVGFGGADSVICSSRSRCRSQLECCHAENRRPSHAH